MSEIKLLNNLNKIAANIVQPVKSRNDNYIETVKTNLGQYNAVVFKGIQGEQLDFAGLTRNHFYNWGRELGKLHKYSNQINNNSSYNLDSWEEHLQFIEENLQEEENSALQELELIKDWINRLSVSEKNFGIIHFDFELDNLIYNNKRFNIIDFDDAAYYWYTADIAFALRDLFDDKVNLKEERFKAFINGYGNEFTIEKDLLKNLSMFLRFHNLLTFTKLIKAVDIKPDKNQPDWLIGLIDKLNNVIDGYRKSF